ncbi:MAG: hypothetical protein LBR10_07550, partial [Prevotellaceae bacterium]|nr:hypothetical protein [Prevotellaceae bacterium]
TVYTSKLLIYNTEYGLWLNPATSTPLVLDDLKDAENAFFPVYRDFYGMVKASPLVTNADLEGMGFSPRPDGSRSHHPVNKMFININVIPFGAYILKIAFENRDTGSSVIPYYLAGAIIFFRVSDTPVTDPNELTQFVLATRSPYKLVFDPSQRGKYVYIAARWQNKRGEKGHWSEIICVVVP